MKILFLLVFSKNLLLKNGNQRINILKVAISATGFLRPALHLFPLLSEASQKSLEPTGNRWKWG